MSSFAFVVLFAVVSGGTFVAASQFGRASFLMVPLIVWPVFYVGLLRGWWGYGVGDGWYFVALLVTLAGLAIVGVGLLIHWARPDSRSGEARGRG